MQREVAKLSFDGGIDGNGWRFENSDPISRLKGDSSPCSARGAFDVWEINRLPCVRGGVTALRGDGVVVDKN